MGLFYNVDGVLVKDARKSLDIWHAHKARRVHRLDTSEKLAQIAALFQRR